ncbi:hypothetical protein [uncultured Roseovarius sp.]|uniref:hypothetical protein n=1 Tax=uncultured Roseovarius sp. TaxID=293344 RepID=UPI002596B4D0|nr:hypothetical protein [uncultured Roseovarius sp.]
MREIHKLGAVATLLCTVALSAANAETTMSLTSGFPPGSIPERAHKELAGWMEENSDIRLNVSAMTLLTFPEASPGVGQGIADMAYFVTPYHKAEYSESNLAAEMSMLSTIGTPSNAPGLAMAGAFAEYVTLNCDDCQTQFKMQNNVYLGTGASSEYGLFCREPIAGPEDLAGKKFRVGAENYGRWAEHFGAVKVSVPGSEIYEAMSIGVVDCTALSTPELENWQLYDVTAQVTTAVPGGVYAGVSSNAMNRDLWQSLTDEERATMLRGAGIVSAGVAGGYFSDALTAEAKAEEKGVDVVPAAEALASETEALAKADMATIAEQYTSIYGIEDVEAKMETISALVEVWKERINGIDPKDNQAFADLLWENVYSKLDPATYGMN